MIDVVNIQFETLEDVWDFFSMMPHDLFSTLMDDRRYTKRLIELKNQNLISYHTFRADWFRRKESAWQVEKHERLAKQAACIHCEEHCPK